MRLDGPEINVQVELEIWVPPLSLFAVPESSPLCLHLAFNPHLFPLRLSRQRFTSA